MKVIEVTKDEKGRICGQLLKGQLSKDEFDAADQTLKVVINKQLAEVLDPAKNLLVCEKVEWSTTRKSWIMQKPTLVNYPLPENSDFWSKVCITDDDKARFVSESMLSSIKKDDSVSIDKEGYYVSQDVWSLLVRNIKRRGGRYKNTLLVGPSGCGKTSLIKVACEKLGIPFSKFDMGACNGDATSTLLGVHRIVDGKSVFDYADFVDKIQKPGVIVLDEINRADYSAMNILLPLLDDSRVLKVDVAGSTDKRVIPVHPDCIFVATANIGSEYAGTNEMDSALKNRFLAIEISDMPIAEEIKVLKKKCDISEKSAKIVVKAANSLRDNYKSGKISYKISTRETLEVGDLIHDGFDEKSALKCIFLPKFTGSLTEGEKSIAAQSIDTF